MAKKYSILLLFFTLFCGFTSLAGGPGDTLKVQEAPAHIGGDVDLPDGEDGDVDDLLGEEEEEDAYADTSSSSAFNRFLDTYSTPAHIPASSVYENWNTQIIHPYKFDVAHFRDTVNIPLQDEHMCDYSHPFLGEITSNFGPRRSRYHFGIDIKLETGECVNNAFEGIVRIAQYSKTYGNVVVVRHNNGLETFYAHLSEMNVRPGDHLQAGELIGLGGNTGRSTGPHLHFEVRYKGKPINPNDIIDFNAGVLKGDELAITPKTFSYVKQITRSKYHVIRRGDTLTKIAKRHGTTVKKLCKLNRITTRTKLKPGRRLRTA